MFRASFEGADSNTFIPSCHVRATFVLFLIVAIHLYLVELILLLFSESLDLKAFCENRSIKEFLK